MAKSKNIEIDPKELGPLNVGAPTIEAVDFDTEVESPAEFILEAEVETIAVSSAVEVDDLWAELEAIVATLGQIGHLYYAKKAGEDIKNLIDRIRSCA